MTPLRTRKTSITARPRASGCGVNRLCTNTRSPSAALRRTSKRSWGSWLRVPSTNSTRTLRPSGRLGLCWIRSSARYWSAWSVLPWFQTTRGSRAPVGCWRWSSDAPCRDGGDGRGGGARSQGQTEEGDGEPGEGEADGVGAAESLEQRGAAGVADHAQHTEGEQDDRDGGRRGAEPGREVGAGHAVHGELRGHEEHRGQQGGGGAGGTGHVAEGAQRRCYPPSPARSRSRTRRNATTVSRAIPASAVRQPTRSPRKVASGT